MPSTNFCATGDQELDESFEWSIHRHASGSRKSYWLQYLNLSVSVHGKVCMAAYVPCVEKTLVNLQIQLLQLPSHRVGGLAIIEQYEIPARVPITAYWFRYSTSSYKIQFSFSLIQHSANGVC